MSVYDNATPRTDALVRDYGHNGYHERYVDLCRELERQLALAADAAQTNGNLATKYLDELDKANARIDYLMSPDSSSPEGTARDAIIDECIEACRKEYLDDPMKDTGDEDYDNAIKHCIDALHALKSSNMNIGGSK